MKTLECDELIQQAVSAEAETDEIEFKDRFETDLTQSWCEIVKDIVAIANSGGGVVVFGLDDQGKPAGEDISEILTLDPAHIVDKVDKYTGVQFANFRLIELEKEGHRIAALRIFGSAIPMIFLRPGTYPVSDRKQRSAFSRGTVYFRHGAKSEPGNQADLRQVIEKRINTRRELWLANIRKVVEAPSGSQLVVVPPDESRSKGAAEIPIRVVTEDKAALKYRKISPDVTHPYRQTEVLEEVSGRLGEEKQINRYDIQAVTAVHNVRENANFCHVPRYSSPQYSTAYVDWIIEQYEKSDTDFFEECRDRYYELRYRDSG
ncbi:MAG: RNA-binding domain-containing protein [bacterium]